MKESKRIDTGRDNPPRKAKTRPARTDVTAAKTQPSAPSDITAAITFSGDDSTVTMHLDIGQVVEVVTHTLNQAYDPAKKARLARRWKKNGEWMETLVNSHIDWALSYVAEHFETVLTEALRQLVAQSVAKYDGLFLVKLDPQGGEVKASYKKQVKELTRAGAKSVRQRLGISPGGRRWGWSDEDLEELLRAYEKRYRLWKRVLAFYRKVKPARDWQNQIAREFANERVPLELVERLDSQNPYLAQPSEIAIEHARRDLTLDCGRDQIQKLLTRARHRRRENEAKT